jgi:hypothetical protein
MLRWFLDEELHFQNLRVWINAILYVSLVIFVLTASSCRRTPVMPVDEATLVKVLADVHIAEVAAQNFAGAYKDSIKRIYYQQIYEIHGISEADFKSSLQVLSDHQDKMEKLYKKVETQLESMDKPQK